MRLNTGDSRKYHKFVHYWTNECLNVDRKICAVYFFIKDNEIIYIGQTRNLKSRVCTHKSYPAWRYDYFRYIECRPEDLVMIERRLIFKFMPSLNVMHKKVRTA
jgi:excinuclease UvrABC nuclease subunit